MLRSLIAFGFRLYGPWHGRFMRLWAYGPWGKYFHSLSIRFFSWLFKIDWKDISSFSTLGDFFLRSVPCQFDSASLISPCEAKIFDGPRIIGPLAKNESKPTLVKGVLYDWKAFKEVPELSQNSWTFWNFYLAPRDYHWVHAPCGGRDLQVFHRQGRLWPVNGLGRWLQPLLFSENDRMTFRWRTDEGHRMIMICVGAMGVSSLRLRSGHALLGQWAPLSEIVTRGEALLAFELGSTVLLFAENCPKPFPLESTQTRVGMALCDGSC